MQLSVTLVAIFGSFNTSRSSKIFYRRQIMAMITHFSDTIIQSDVKGVRGDPVYGAVTEPAEEVIKYHVDVPQIVKSCRDKKADRNLNTYETHIFIK